MDCHIQDYATYLVSVGFDFVDSLVIVNFWRGVGVVDCQASLRIGGGGFGVVDCQASVNVGCVGC